MAKIKIYILLIVLSGLFSWMVPATYSMDDYASYLNALITISSVVFTIMGIWIAFLYPNALKRIADQTIQVVDFTQTKSETKRLESLVGTVVISALVTLGVLILFFSKLVITNTQFFCEYSSSIKSFLLFIVLFLSMLQCEAIMHVVYSNVMFLNDLHAGREAKEADADI